MLMDSIKPTPSSVRVFISVLISALAFIACDQATADVGMISSEQLQEKTREGETPLILDVRSAGEYAAGHIPGAINIPHDQLSARMSELGVAPSDTIIVYCHSGRRAGMAEEHLASKGYTNVLDLNGHMVDWQKAELPIQKE